MSIFKCKMCGGTLEISESQTTAVCDYCGTEQTLPKLDDERRANLYDRANHFRRNNEFDKAMSIYENILNEDSTDAEAYWSLVLCRYGIEYVEDPTTRKRVPTVNRAQFTSIYDDDNYKSAIANADLMQKTIYEAEAVAINEIQKGILAISQKEDPFDVFICYKETDANGRRTQDSVLANDLYHQLTAEGFKVFFSRITLENKLGVAYEPYIFAALNSAKVMVVLGTKPEYFDAVWVKNEWSRYLTLIKQSEGKKVLIPAYRDMDPYDLPEEFSHLQAQDMSKLGFMQDLVRGIHKIVGIEPPSTSPLTTTPSAPLLKRMFLFLEDCEWTQATEYANKVLDMDPENANAYLGLIMAAYRIKTKEDLPKSTKKLDANRHYKNLIRFADEALRAEMTRINDAIVVAPPEPQPTTQPQSQGSTIEFTVDDKGVLTKISPLPEHLVIPAVFNGKSITEINCHCDNNKHLKSVVIPDSVTKIGHATFRDCTALSSVQLSQNLTKILGGAFEGCTALESIILPDSLEYIGYAAWKGCTSLRSVQCSSRLKFIDGCAFEDCTALQSIVFPNTLKKLDYKCFKGCTSLKQVSIPLSVEDVSYNSFEGCESLVNRENGVHYIDRWVVGADEGLTAATIRNGTVGIAASAFAAHEQLAEISIPESVVHMATAAFWSCHSLTTIRLPGALKKLTHQVFGNSGLRTLTVPKSVTFIEGNPFWRCASLESVVFEEEIEGYRVVDNCLIDIKEECLRACWSRYVCPADGSVKHIACMYESPICGTPQPMNITIPAGTVTVEASMLSELDRALVTQITLPDSVRTIGKEAFAYCTSLREIILPEQLTEIGEEAFNYCISLSDLTIPNGVKSIGKGAFEDTNLKEIIVPDSVTYLGDYAFRGCELKRVSLPVHMTTIPYGLFHYCPFEVMVIPEGITAIRADAFLQCEALHTLELPSTLKKIDGCAFWHCVALKKITFHGSCAQWNDLQRADGWDRETDEYTLYFTEGEPKSISKANVQIFDSQRKSVDELLARAEKHIKNREDAKAVLCFEEVIKIIPHERIGYIGKSIALVSGKGDVSCGKLFAPIQEAKNKTVSSRYATETAKFLNYPVGEHRETLLMYACVGVVLWAVQTLLDMGADIHSMSTFNTTALWYVCREKLDDDERNAGIEIARLLIDKGADVHVTNKGGVALYNKRTDPEIAKMIRARFPGLKMGASPESKSGGCYIATAVYGSYDCPEVWTLRRYRDHTLSKTLYGRAFIHTYYAISPTLVKWFGKDDWFKRMWQSKLDRMVKKLNATGVENTPYKDREW